MKKMGGYSLSLIAGMAAIYSIISYASASCDNTVNALPGQQRDYDHSLSDP